MAAPNVLPFPQTKRALRHYSTGMDAAGFLSLMLMERSGERIPANVVRFDEPEGAGQPERSPALLLAVLMFSAFSKRQQEQVRRWIRGMAYSNDPDPVAVQLGHMLNGRGGL